ncbi:hypothetical protein pb186bvf_000811 [Paramecium bursaria]
MSQLNVKIIDEKQPRTQSQKELTDEPMSKINKLSILNESLSFNEQKIQAENCRIVLVKLIYLYNQGVQFSEQEVEQLFFRITKLFAANSSRLRAMTYKVLKIIMQQKFIHMIFQCVTKDLINDNQFIKIEALKFIPFIQDEEYIVQLERFIHNALIDKNVLISSAAIIVGIHIVTKYPNLVYKWLFDVVQNLDQKQENLNYHSLILFHEIKKTNSSQFMKIIILMTKKQLQSLMHFQIIKFIKDILPLTENAQKKEQMTYLFRQVDSKDPLTAFQSSQILINNFEVQNNELISVQQYILEHLHYEKNNIEIYSSLKLIHQITTDTRQELITYEQVYLIKVLTFNYRVALSKMGILFFVKFNIQYTDNYLNILFNQVSYKQIHFLKGLREIIIDNQEYTNLVIDFLNCAFSENRDNKLINFAIQIVESILKVSKQYLKEAYPILILLTENSGNKDKFIAIKKIIRILLNLKSSQLDNGQLNFFFSFLQKEIELSQINQDKLNYLRNQYLKFEKKMMQSKNQKQ